MSLYGQRIDETGFQVSGSQSNFALSARDLLTALQSRGSKENVIAWVTRLVATAIEMPEAWITFDFDETTGAVLELSTEIPG